MRGNLTFPLFLTEAGLNDSGLGALVGGFGEESGEHRREEIDQGVGEEKEEECDSITTPPVPSAVFVKPELSAW